MGQIFMKLSPAFEKKTRPLLSKVGKSNINWLWVNLNLFALVLIKANFKLLRLETYLFLIVYLQRFVTDHLKSVCRFYKGNDFDRHCLELQIYQLSCVKLQLTVSFYVSNFILTIV